MKCKDCDNWKCLDRSYGEAECVHYKCDGQSSISQQSSLQSFNWQSFRAEAAKDILCALIPFGKDEGLTKEETLEYCVKNAVFIADKLITKLKEKEGK
jgi:hypothetical protein